MQAKAVYFDSSVILAMLFNQAAAESALEIWNNAEYRLSSQLTEFECLTVVHRVHGTLPEKIRKEVQSEHQRWLSRSLAALELQALGDAIGQELQADMRYGGLRTLDAIHLAAAQLFRTAGIVLSIATFDRRMRDAAKIFGFHIEADE